MENTVKKPSVAVAGIVLLAAIAAIVLGIKLSLGVPISVLMATVVVSAYAISQKISWIDIQKRILENIDGSMVAFLILVFVGMLVGIWIVGGTIPSLIYYGLQIISPSVLVPLTFLLCAVTSVFTGTSFGSIATMGLALYGVGTAMGIPAPLIAGAVVSGSMFGDKMSPMSDTTNVASTMAGTDLYSHIGSMFYTTIPATVVVTVAYVILGLQYSGEVDAENILLITDTLQANYNISPLACIPLVAILVFSAMKMPALMAMCLTAAISFLFAMFTQGLAPSAIASAASSGYVSTTGVSLVDVILTRGGITSMITSMCTVLFASALAGALQAAQILEVVVDGVLMKLVKNSQSLIIGTLVYAWGMVAMTGSQVMGIIIPGKTLQPSYDKMNINRKVLSRCLEDAGTLGAPLLPWTSFSIYIVGVLGISAAEYIPYSFLCFLVPIFSIICALTGFGTWDSEGNKRWGKSKAKAAKVGA